MQDENFIHETEKCNVFRHYKFTSCNQNRKLTNRTNFSSKKENRRNFSRCFNYATVGLVAESDVPAFCGKRAETCSIPFHRWSFQNSDDTSSLRPQIPFTFYLLFIFNSPSIPILATEVSILKMNGFHRQL